MAILNLLQEFIDKFIVHVPEDKQEELKKDGAALIGIITEAAAKGTAEGVVDGAKGHQPGE